MIPFDSHKWLVFSAAAAAGWGLQYAMAEQMLKTMRPLAWLTCYFVGGALACLGASVLMERTVPVARGQNATLMFACVLIGVVAQLAILLAIQGKNATHASLIENAVPLFAIIGSAVLFGEWHLTMRSGLGAILILGGMALVALEK